MEELLNKANELRQLIVLENEKFHSAAMDRRRIAELKEIFNRINELRQELNNILIIIDNFQANAS